MPEVIFPGPEGRLEGRFNPVPRPRAPVALILLMALRWRCANSVLRSAEKTSGM